MKIPDYDQDIYHITDERFLIKTPFSIVIIGPFGCGKTNLLYYMLACGHIMK